MNDRFLSRWAKRKAQARRGASLPEPAPSAASAAGVSVPKPAQADAAGQPGAATDVADAARALLPTLADAQNLPAGSDIAAYLDARVDESVRRVAFKRLFADPHFNAMDGLDTYIDDYSKPDPLPPSMLRQLTQTRSLGLFGDDEADPPQTQAPPPDTSAAADPGGGVMPEVGATRAVPGGTLPAPDARPASIVQQAPAAHHAVYAEPDSLPPHDS